MAKATLHLDNVGGHAAPARVWRLDPPAQINGQQHEFVAIWIIPGAGYQDPEVVTVAATETGAIAGRSVQRRAGSYVLPGNPDTLDYVNGAHWLALQLLGGYEIVSDDNP